MAPSIHWNPLKGIEKPKMTGGATEETGVAVVVQENAQAQLPDLG